MQTPAFYGLIRVIYDLKGTDCYTFFTDLAKSDGLRLQTQSSTTTPALTSAKGYAFEYYQDQKNLIVGSKVACDDTRAIELMVVSPNDKQYNADINTILQDAQLTLPETQTQ